MSSSFPHSFFLIFIHDRGSEHSSGPHTVLAWKGARNRTEKSLCSWKLHKTINQGTVSFQRVICTEENLKGAWGKGEKDFLEERTWGKWLPKLHKPHPVWMTEAWRLPPPFAGRHAWWQRLLCRSSYPEKRMLQRADGSAGLLAREFPHCEWKICICMRLQGGWAAWTHSRHSRQCHLWSFPLHDVLRALRHPNGRLFIDWHLWTEDIFASCLIPALFN